MTPDEPGWFDRRGERLSPHQLLISILGGKCDNCGSILGLQVHHKTPLASGGTNRIENLALLCRRCHMGETEKFAKIGRLRSFDRVAEKGQTLQITRKSTIPGEDLKEPYWFEVSDLYRFDDEAALAHVWRVTAVSEKWKPTTVQRRHDRACELPDCPLRGSGVVSLIGRRC